MPPAHRTPAIDEARQEVRQSGRPARRPAHWRRPGSKSLRPSPAYTRGRSPGKAHKYDRMGDGRCEEHQGPRQRPGHDELAADDAREKPDHGLRQPADADDAARADRRRRRRQYSTCRWRPARPATDPPPRPRSAPRSGPLVRAMYTTATKTRSIRPPPGVRNRASDVCSARATMIISAMPAALTVSTPPVRRLRRRRLHDEHFFEPVEIDRRAGRGSPCRCRCRLDLLDFADDESLRINAVDARRHDRVADLDVGRAGHEVHPQHRPRPSR